MISKLRQARLLKGKSQYLLESETGIHQALISLFERGYRIPNSKQKSLLAKALKVKKDWLFPEDNKEDSNGLRCEAKAVRLKKK